MSPAIRNLAPSHAGYFSIIPITSRGDSAQALIVATDAPIPLGDSHPCRTAFDRVKAAIHTISSLGPHAGLDVIKKTVVEAARGALQTDMVALYTIDPVTGGVDCEATSYVREELRRAFWDGFASVVTDRERQGPWMRNIEQQGTYCALADLGAREIMACPIRSEAGASGVLVAFYPSAIDLVDLRTMIIESLAAQATAAISFALAIEQSRCLLDDLAGANQKLSLQATIDGLTGLANHRTMQLRLSELCRCSSNRENRRFSLVMIDVDHFKFYNDAHGHQEGDSALRGVARIIASGLRQDDFAARYGGEEFALILSGVDKEAAQRIAERIRCAVADHPFPKGRLTVSLGVAEYPADGATPGEIIERSDRALYHAKTTGRNRVVAWGSAGCASPGGEPDAPDANQATRAVLVVDLDKGRGKSLRDMVRSENYTVDTSTSADAACELLKTRKFDIVLVAAGGDGGDLKCLSTISAIHPNMPIVLFTDALSAEANRDAFRSGASDVLPRPGTRSELPIVIERNLERTRVQKQRLAEKSTGVMLQAIEALVAAIDARDPFTAGHTAGVTSTALAISDHLDISSDDRSALELAARLHDIGKVGLPDSALNKQSALTDEEWRAMREHPALGSRIVGTIDELAYVSSIIRHHHERLDGSGYPDALEGEAIPYLAQVLAVADAYEGMTAERAHRSPLAPREAIDELRFRVGTYYAPEIVDVLAKLVTESVEAKDKAA